MYTGVVNSYTKKELQLFKKLSTPARIQDYLNTLAFNFEEAGDTCMSPRRVVETQKAHCLEGALFAAAALEFHGAAPLVLDLRSSVEPYDFDHVVAIFTQFDCFGAISKTNHAVLRYREPIYQSVRELVLSYFHEYFLSGPENRKSKKTGFKTLREYSDPCDLTYFDSLSRSSSHPVTRSLNWRTSSENMFEIPEYLDQIPHHPILTPAQIKNLRPADAIEIEAGKIVEYVDKSRVK